MYYGNINHLNDETLLTGDFADCLSFMKIALKKTVVNGEQIKINNNCIAYYQRYKTRKSKLVSFESHRQNYDIQFMVNGEEIIETTSSIKLNEKHNYNSYNDITFYEDPDFVTSNLVLKNGDFLIVGPNDAHKPGIIDKQSDVVQKIVIKVPVK